MSWSELSFSDGTRADMERHAIVLSAEWQLSARHTLQVGWGGVPRGRLETTDGTFDLAPGWVGSVAFAWRLYDGSGPWPFVFTSFSFSGSSARTEEDPGGKDRRAHFGALDLRGGLTIGKTLWEAVSPYVAIRVFGGPIFWDRNGTSVTGSDRHHYQPAAGVVVDLGPLDLYGEGAFAGERSVSGGIGHRFDSFEPSLGRAAAAPDAAGVGNS